MITMKAKCTRGILESGAQTENGMEVGCVVSVVSDGPSAML